MHWIRILCFHTHSCTLFASEKGVNRSGKSQKKKFFSCMKLACKQPGSQHQTEKDYQEGADWTLQLSASLSFTEKRHSKRIIQTVPKAMTSLRVRSLLEQTSFVLFPHFWHRNTVYLGPIFPSSYKYEQISQKQRQLQTSQF